MRILIADDEPTARSILSSLFKRLGHEPTAVEDGLKAVEAALTEPHPEIILLDWMMPGLSGPEVAKKIREQHKQIPFRPYILILSSKNNRKEVAQALNDGADDFLSKPPDGSELLARLRVAERMVTHEIELRKTIAELSKMIERHELLGELVVSHQPKTVNSDTQMVHRDEIQGFVTAAFREFNTALTPIDQGNGVRFPNPLCVWEAIVLPQQQAWIDIILEMGEGTAAHCFEQALHRPPTTKEKETLILELHTLIRRMFQASIQSHGIATVTPYGARLKKTEYTELLKTGEANILYSTTNGGPLRVTIIRSLTPKIEKEPKLVNTLEFLPLGFPHNSSTPMINQNTVIDKTIRHKINHLTDDSISTQTVVVMEPTETTKWFQQS
jgi:DNA-binding response OmpR family regulator